MVANIYSVLHYLISCEVLMTDLLLFLDEFDLLAHVEVAVPALDVERLDSGGDSFLLGDFNLLIYLTDRILYPRTGILAHDGVWPIAQSHNEDEVRALTMFRAANDVTVEHFGNLLGDVESQTNAL